MIQIGSYRLHVRRRGTMRAGAVEHDERVEQIGHDASLVVLGQSIRQAKGSVTYFV